MMCDVVLGSSGTEARVVSLSAFVLCSDPVAVGVYGTCDDHTPDVQDTESVLGHDWCNRTVVTKPLSDPPIAPLGGPERAGNCAKKRLKTDAFHRPSPKSLNDPVDFIQMFFWVDNLWQKCSWFIYNGSLRTFLFLHNGLDSTSSFGESKGRSDPTRMSSAAFGPIP